MPNLFLLTLAVLGFAVAGCAPISPPPTFSRADPANPNAPEAGYPAAMPVLMVGTNYAMSPESEAQPMDMPEHDSKSMKMPQRESHGKTSDKTAENESHAHNPAKQ